METPNDTPSPPISNPQQSPSDSSQARAAPANTNPRSCVTCRRRKVRCDKKRPCTNCVKAGNTECVFPGPGRAPRRPKNPAAMSAREMELLKRLRRLEGMVQGMNEQAEVEATQPSFNDPIMVSQPQAETRPRPTGTVRVIGMDEGTGSAKSWLGRLANLGDRPPSTQLMEQDLGRLIIDEGKSRYLSTNFWNSLSQEVGDIREIFEDELYAEDETSPEDIPNPYVTPVGNHNSFVMGYSSSEINLREYHPLPSQIPFYWQTFLENVDPITKLVHVPTMTKTISEVRNNLDSLRPSTEALMFAVYFATIVSMSPEDVTLNFGVDKKSLLTKYRFAVEQALAKAEFLMTSEIVTLQAFVLFLIAVRSHDDGRFVFSLTGLAIRLAQGLGLHRDGSHFGLSPFDTEMRRRIWWHCCLLDLRASEDHGVDCFLLGETFDTKKPLNINDADMDPSQVEPIQPREGATEMTFPLIRFHLAESTRKMNAKPVGPNGIATAISLEEKEAIIRECSATLEEKYLKYCARETPLFWVAATIARLILAKASLLTYHPFQSPSMVKRLSKEMKDRLLISSLEVIEYSRLLEIEASTKQWSWIFHTYVQWHAVSYALAELCMRPYEDPLIERTWAAVDTVFTNWGDAVRYSKNGAMWLPLKKLMAKARRRRQDEMKRREAIMQGIPVPPVPLVETRLGEKLGVAKENMPVICARTGAVIRQAALEYTTGLPASLPSMDTSPGQADMAIINNNFLTSGNASNNGHMSEHLHGEQSITATVSPGVAFTTSTGSGTPAMEAITPNSNPMSTAPTVPWLMDDSALLDLDDPNAGADWESWDDLMRDLQMTGEALESLQEMEMRQDGNVGGVENWWK